MNGLSSAISGVGSAIGRYFSVVSFIPSFFLVAFTYALIESGAWSGDSAPDWGRSGSAFTHLGNVAVLILLSIMLGVAVHPVQFSLVQFFEGYWGSSRLAQRLRTARMTQHSHRLHHLMAGRGVWAGVDLDAADDRGVQIPRDFRIKLVSVRDEDYRLRRGYPEKYDDIMPTRLGNVLRRYERLAGYQYNLDAVQVIRQIAFVAPKQHLDYLNDQRELLDLSVRMCATAICAAFIAIAFLWHHGPWLAIALIPYGVAYLSYRGAVVVAHEYGAAICAVIDLDRFALYEALRIPLPKDTAAELSTNEDLRDFLDHFRTANFTYEHPVAPGSADDAPGSADDAPGSADETSAEQETSTT